nr:MAG TPA: hypothetical protein [Caudoviricetes sp.]
MCSRTVIRYYLLSHRVYHAEEGGGKGVKG